MNDIPFLLLIYKLANIMHDVTPISSAFLSPAVAWLYAESSLVVRAPVLKE